MRRAGTRALAAKSVGIREVPDELWERIEPLLPKKRRRFRYPGRRPLDDRRV